MSRPTPSSVLEPESAKSALPAARYGGCDRRLALAQRLVRKSWRLWKPSHSIFSALARAAALRPIVVDRNSGSLLALRPTITAIRGDGVAQLPTLISRPLRRARVRAEIAAIEGR